MPIKELIYQLQPVQLYVILTLSICYFILQLFLSHITHALTLLINSYHMLCNIIALAGCIITIKLELYEHSQQIQKLREKKEINDVPKEEARFVEVCVDNKSVVHQDSHSHASKLHNTFGWTRVDILTMLIVCIFLASLSFSLLVEALQTLVHIDHQDAMHLPIPVFILGAMGLVLNGLCYLLIGGYTMHQGSFFHVTSSGDVVLENVAPENDLKDIKANGKAEVTKVNDNSHRPSTQIDLSEPRFQPGQRQGAYEMFRDICSTLFVMICAVIIYFSDNEQVSKFIDPIMSIMSCLLLLFLSYPYMKESCFILLQTIPGSIDIEQFKSTLLNKFNEIVSVHDLHIWQLTSHKYVSTVHIIFRDQKIYTKIIDDIKSFFHEQGITNVTIQPEFKDTNAIQSAHDCYLQCADIRCVDKHCCKQLDAKPTEIVVQPNTTIHEEAKAEDKTKISANVLEKSKSADDVHLKVVGKETGEISTRSVSSCDLPSQKEINDEKTDEIVDSETKTEVSKKDEDA